MKVDEAIEMEKTAFSQRIEMRMKKASDYAKVGGDCLSNFKVMADIEAALEKHGYKIPIDRPHGVAFWHMLHKLIRLLNLWNEGKEPKNESLEDTHNDLSNYNDLAKECFIDYMMEVTTNYVAEVDETD